VVRVKKFHQKVQRAYGAYSLHSKKKVTTLGKIESENGIIYAGILGKTTEGNPASTGRCHSQCTWGEPAEDG